MVIMARKEITYTPSAEVCSKEIHIVLEDDVIVEVGFKKGCAGNTQGVSALLKGMKKMRPSVGCGEYAADESQLHVPISWLKPWRIWRNLTVFLPI